ncbi:MAG: transposase [Maledivibacter sp.]|jgi:plastocyanin|nr:transposase [Maledivibacter sp.]
MSEILETVESSDDCILYPQDETYIRTESNNRRIWSPIGVSPILERNATHNGINAIGATEVLKNFDTVIDIYHSQKSITSVEIKAFLEHLLEINPGKKVYLVWDDARTHTSTMIQQYLKVNEKRLITINSPKYSLGMNHQENLWNRLKALLFRPSARCCIEELMADIFDIYCEFNSSINGVYLLTYAKSFLV